MIRVSERFSYVYSYHPLSKINFNTLSSPANIHLIDPPNFQHFVMSRKVYPEIAIASFVPLKDEY